MKRIIKIAEKFIKNILSAIVAICGVVCFFIACVMYFRGYYQNCQCLMLILIFLFLKCWKDETLKNELDKSR